MESKVKHAHKREGTHFFVKKIAPGTPCLIMLMPSNLSRRYNLPQIKTQAYFGGAQVGHLGYQWMNHIRYL